MIIETIKHRLYNATHGTDWSFYRWSVSPRIVIGGSIIDGADWAHLRDDLGVGAVLNVETEHSDLDKEIEKLCEVQVPDDGSFIPYDMVKKALFFSNDFLKSEPTKKLYIHCQMGGSRSPGFAYGVLRFVDGLSEGEALDVIRKGQARTDPNGGTGAAFYGEHRYHQTYMSSMENFIANGEKRGPG